MSWFTQMLQNLISFPYLEEYLSSVVHPWWFRKLLVLLCSIMIDIYLAGCACSFWLYVYKKMNKDQETDFDSKLWEKPRRFFSLIIDTYGRIWHGYEVAGMENLPKGPGIVIYHHGVAPLGYVLFAVRIFLRDGETVLFINFIVWGVGCQPIIPIFTQNSCEAYRTIGKTRLTKWLYDKTRCIFLPVYGGFPVKLRTFIGEPIPYDPNITAVELAERAKTALDNLRDKHQKRPGNILNALSERFDKHYKAN
ncbi:monoacylglycerol/Diacylglycerol O-acyltransferase isoform X2 [Zootoca vivipara]|uniref:monoacylglycerol/Diacylglycerol O-acyltransferase isoform X2 n=1 Tax=Zootoca vivipara TaxID=8524 RepID=UPI00293BBD5A|nr:monoacylglycerol/Diacylglycerol O-acyltransferase isoform X2 [Zootoca vivipara]